MSVYTTPTITRNTVPDTVETVAYDETGDILLWVEDAPTTPCKWDDFEGEPTAGFQEVQPRELPEVDFMNEVADRLQANGCPGLHEDPEDGDPIGYWESIRPVWF